MVEPRFTVERSAVKAYRIPAAVLYRQRFARHPGKTDDAAEFVGNLGDQSLTAPNRNAGLAAESRKRCGGRRGVTRLHHSPPINFQPWLAVHIADLSSLEIGTSMPSGWTQAALG